MCIEIKKNLNSQNIKIKFKFHIQLNKKIQIYKKKIFKRTNISTANVYYNYTYIILCIYGKVEKQVLVLFSYLLNFCCTLDRASGSW